MMREANQENEKKSYLGENTKLKLILASITDLIIGATSFGKWKLIYTTNIYTNIY